MEDIQNMEDVLERLGGFGLFQAFLLFVVLFPELPTASAAMIANYAGQPPEYWECLVEVSENETAIQTTSYLLPHSQACECNGTLSSSSFSVVTEWNLVCSKSWIPGLLTSLFMCGMCIGALLGSQVSDWIGRKKAMYLTCVVFLVSNGAATVAQSPVVYAIARVVTGYSNATLLLLASVYPMEFFTPKYRGLSGNLGTWGYGIIILGLWGYLSTSWQMLTLLGSAPMLLMFLTYPFIPESPRWLLQRGKVTEARRVFDQIAKWNGRDKLDDGAIQKLSSLMSVVDVVVVDPEQQKSTTGKGTQQTSGFAYFFTDARYRLTLFKFMFMWFSASVTYYTISFNAQNLSSDMNLNMVYMGLADALAYPFATVLLAKLGTKNLGRLSLGAGATVISLLVASRLFVDIGPGGNALLGIVLTLMAKFMFVGSWASAKVFTGESFPTTMRSTAIGICRIASASGGVLSPQIIFLGKYHPMLPFGIVGCVSVVSLLVVSTIGDTRGKPIVED